MKSIITLCSKKIEDRTATREFLMDAIQILQHERLVHLLITILTALLFFLAAAAMIFIPCIVTDILFVVIFIFLFCYIHYYCYLENSLQKLEKELLNEFEN